MSKRAVIVGGGTVAQGLILAALREWKPDYIIGVDSGLAFLHENQIMPTHIVGDFDSVPLEIIEYYKKETTVPIREFNPVKDASDTEIAVRLAIELGVEQLVLFGATGTR